MSGFATRQPAAIGAAITAAAPVVLLALVACNVIEIDDNEQQTLVAAIGGLTVAISGLIGWWHTYRNVTPVADPHDNAGRALVPAPPNTAKGFRTES
jgi:hypothetical protein